MAPAPSMPPPCPVAPSTKLYHGAVQALSTACPLAASCCGCHHWCAVLAHASWVLQSRAEQPPDAPPQQGEAVVSLPEITWCCFTCRCCFTSRDPLAVAASLGAAQASVVFDGLFDQDPVPCFDDPDDERRVPCLATRYEQTKKHANGLGVKTKNKPYSASRQYISSYCRSRFSPKWVKNIFYCLWL
jgi:hypothetical protein